MALALSAAALVNGINSVASGGAPDRPDSRPVLTGFLGPLARAWRWACRLAGAACVFFFFLCPFLKSGPVQTGRPPPRKGGGGRVDAWSWSAFNTCLFPGWDPQFGDASKRDPDIMHRYSVRSAFAVGIGPIG